MRLQGFFFYWFLYSLLAWLAPHSGWMAVANSIYLLVQFTQQRKSLSFQQWNKRPEPAGLVCISGAISGARRGEWRPQSHDTLSSKLVLSFLLLVPEKEWLVVSRKCWSREESQSQISFLGTSEWSLNPRSGQTLSCEERLEKAGLPNFQSKQSAEEVGKGRESWNQQKWDGEINGWHGTR